MGRNLVILGAAIVVIGLAWPWLSRLGLGRLPGDFMVERGSTRFYFPLTSSILVSLLISLVLWLLRR